MNYNIALRYQAHAVTFTGTKKPEPCKCYVERKTAIRLLKRLFAEHLQSHLIRANHDEIKGKIERRIMDMENFAFRKLYDELQSDPLKTLCRFLPYNGMKKSPNDIVIIDTDEL